MAANVSGMEKLAIWLTENMALQHLPEAEQSQWTHIAKQLETGAGLEQALQSIGDNLSVSLTSRIINLTWNLIRADEYEPLLLVASRADVVGFIRLFQRFFESTQRYLNIVTTTMIT